LPHDPAITGSRQNSGKSDGHMQPVYPDFVFKEFLVALGCLLILAWLGLLVQAPLDVSANPAFTPNPAKAPWYFLGIQELLVYFDGWLAGIIIPLVIVAGLLAIPFLDNDPAGAGRFTLRRRPWAVVPFTAGVLLWVLLTIMAAWFRGSNWDWYWPWESWGMAKPARTGFASLSRPWGLALIGGYYLGGFLLLGALLRRRYRAWGGLRTITYAFLALSLTAVALKIVLRLAFNLRYILSTPWFRI
jgi:Cytochrome b(C-terminal)/b6/petD